MNGDRHEERHDPWHRLATSFRSATAATVVVVLVIDRGPLALVIGSALWLAGVAALAWTRPPGDPESAAARRFAEGVLGAVVVAATGGITSPLLLALVGPVVLAGLRAEIGTVLVLALLSVPVFAVPGGDVVRWSLEAAALAGLVLLAGRSRLAARPAVPDRSRVELELDRVRDASQLLAQAQDRLDGRSLPGSLEDLLHEVRGWLRPPRAPGVAPHALVEPDVIALRPGDRADRDWLQLGADDVVRTSDRHDLPTALVHADIARRSVVLVPDVAAGEGLDPGSRRAAYLWFDVDEELVAVLALEWDRPAAFTDDERHTLDVLRVLLEELAAALASLRRLREDAQAGERQRLATQLHDRFGQDLAYLVVELTRAQQRHPGDRELPPLTDAVRQAVAGVRTTIGELRRADPATTPRAKYAAARMTTSATPRWSRQGNA